MKNKILLGLTLIMILLSAYLPNTKVENINHKKDQFKVEIKGAVEKPGIYEMPYNATVADLIDLAVLSENADMSTINQSYILYPESVIVIKEKQNNLNLISINSASIEELCALPGIKTGLAQRIIDYRESNCFKCLEDLMKVKGIGIKKYEKLKEFICL